jgi:hypothetical protein
MMNVHKLEADELIFIAYFEWHKCRLRWQRLPVELLSNHGPPCARLAGCAWVPLRPCARPRSGLLPSLIGVCHVAIQFPLYEYAKEQLAQRSGCSPDELPPGQLVRPSPAMSIYPRVEGSAMQYESAASKAVHGRTRRGGRAHLLSMCMQVDSARNIVDYRM